MSVYSLIFCDLPTCDWETTMPCDAGAAFYAMRRLRHHFIEDHGDHPARASSRALSAITEQVPR